MFKLSKWYLDCVTEQGDASIAYTGEMVWGKAEGETGGKWGYIDKTGKYVWSPTK